MTDPTHHLHLDNCEHGHLHVHCLRCGANEIGTFPAEPCPHPEVAVLCDSGYEAEVVVEMHPEEGL